MRLAIALLLSSLALAQERPAPPDMGQAALGKRIFQARCAECHGADARGSAAFAKQVGAYDPTALDLTRERLLSLSDEELGLRIRSGHGRMKGFNVRLSSTEVSELVAYIRVLGHAHAGKARPGAKQG